MRKIFLVFLLIGLALGMGVFYNFFSPSQITQGSLTASGTTVPTQTSAQQTPPAQTLGATSPQLVLEPVSFSIPKLGIEGVEIESVGLDKQNRMDIPKGEDNVAWYNLGAKPGENGNAVIAGHFDKKTGAPAVFYNIGKLVPGDELITTDRSGKESKFIVTQVVTYPLETFPLEEVFGLSNKQRLNLITCEGTYNKSSKLYSHRLVVYSELQN